ncbi:MAG: phosphoribulokinase [Methanotrichaceae archaeon]
MHLADKLRDSSRVFVVAVAGDSGSGKTTLSTGMKRLLGEDMVSSFSMDDYHSLDREQRKIKKITPLNPEANHLSLLAEHLAALRKGETIQKPIYDHSTGKIVGPVSFKSAPVLILEGLHPFYTEDLRRFTDLKIFVDPSKIVKRRWKIRRDCGERGYSPDDVMKEILDREPDYKRYVDIQKIYADVVVKIEDSRLVPPVVQERKQERYSVRLIQQMIDTPLSKVDLTIDLSTILRISEHEFTIGFHREDYYGKRSGVMTIDGELHKNMIEDLEQKLCSLIGPYTPVCNRNGGEYVSAIGMAQLILCWRFLENLEHHLRKA